MKLSECVEECQLTNKLTEVSKSVKRVLRYTPKTKADKATVMEGNYPDDLNWFIHCLKIDRSPITIDDDFRSIRWVYDEKDPHILITVWDKNPA